MATSTLCSRTRLRARRVAPLFLVVLGVGCEPAPAPGFDPLTATIAELHDAILGGRLTAVEIVDTHLARIEAYNRQGPALNAITVVNPEARARAAELDAVFGRTSELSGALHGIPVIVKDNYDTHDLATMGGSASLSDALPPTDAFMVQRVRDAGGIVIAKSTMAEFAFSPYETVGSAIPGHTFNPYRLNRVPAGSSGGTGAAVAAGFGVVGLGTDTGNSIRGPSSHAALVGVRPTMGLTSRSGIVPLYLERDVGGPMTRTVADAARLLDVLAAPDPEDPVTLEQPERPATAYLDALRPDALRGARLGVARRISDREGADEALLARFDEALRDLEAAGAVVVDPVELPVLDEVRVGICSTFRDDLEEYLAGRPGLPRTLDEIVEGGRIHQSVAARVRSLAEQAPGRDPERCAEVADQRERFRAGLMAVLEDLDAIVYPTWSNLPRLVGDLSSPHGDNNQVLAPSSGFPAVTVPMGWVDGLPVGLQLLGPAWSEAQLLGLAYAYEQATGHRRPPESTPPLSR